MPTETTAPVDEPRPGVPEVPAFPILRNHRTQTEVPISGWKSVFLGLPFVAAGTLMAVAALNQIAARKPAPDWLMWAASGLFLAGGSVYAIHGLGDLRRRAAWKQTATARPTEPWLGDYPWQHEGIGFSETDEVLGRLLAALAWTLVFALFAWVGMLKPDGWPILSALGLFSFCCLMLWGRWAAGIFQLMRYGDGSLEYGEFPFRLGGNLQARLRIPRRLSEMDQLTITLRCVQEQFVTSRDGRTATVVCYERHRNVIQMNAAQIAAVGEAGIPVEFRLPERQPSTNLSATPPTYWEIEINGKARDTGYDAIFLVPIYKAQ
ncbi:MAG TPA: hypothetical protein VNK23_08505 [Candidatus Dormibacteraeota bacterium]|nr:hypothetical protein [Candidatus Dormibacteraeota bacterium]